MECRLHARPAEQRCKEVMATASLPVIVPLVAKGLAFAVHDDEHETAAAMSAQPRRHYVTSFFHQGDQCTLANVSSFCRFLRDLRSHPRLAARETMAPSSETSHLSISVASKSFRLMFEWIVFSRRVRFRP